MIRIRTLRLLQTALLSIDSVLLAARRMTQFGPRRPRRTVYFVRTDNLGDLLLWLPALDALRSAPQWEGYDKVLIGNRAWTDLPDVASRFDEVLPIDMRSLRRKPLYRIKTLWRIAGLSGDFVVNPIFSREAVTSDAIARMIKAPRKVAGALSNDVSPWRLPVLDRWYTEVIEFDVSEHKLLRNAKFSEVLGSPPVSPGPGRLTFDTERLPEGLSPGRYVLVCPGAPLNLLKSWPAERWGALLDKIAEAAPQLTIVLAGTPAEAAQCAEVARHTTAKHLNLAGRSDLPTFVALAGGAKAIITTETGASHIGPATATPTLALLGGGHFGRFLPYPPPHDAGSQYHEMSCFGCNWSCRFVPDGSKPAPCMEGVTVDQVWTAVSRVLAPSAQ